MVIKYTRKAGQDLVIAVQEMVEQLLSAPVGSQIETVSLDGYGEYTINMVTSIEVQRITGIRVSVRGKLEEVTEPEMRGIIKGIVCAWVYRIPRVEVV